MNREDVIRLAKEAEVYVRVYYDEPGLTPQELERFATLVEAQQSDKYKALAEELAWAREVMNELTGVGGLDTVELTEQTIAALAKYDCFLQEQQEKEV